MPTDKLTNINDIEYLENYANAMLNIVSNNVIKYRKEKGISQLDLALAIGFKSAAYLGKAEKRKDNQHFNIKQIAKIAKILDIQMSNFFKE